jgi:hypothetical protein
MTFSGKKFYLKKNLKRQVFNDENEKRRPAFFSVEFDIGQMKVSPVDLPDIPQSSIFRDPWSGYLPTP